ncbi:Alpha/Beta hydrolase protein [Xylariales sp. PMI_506]|nr:Alpha/Beta hydrolase protein [Xylariales sp. PMI_506]
MHLSNHAHIGSADQIPVSEPTSIISISPVVLHYADRLVPSLQLRVTVPFPVTPTGDSRNSQPLPIILLSHGHGASNWLSSLEGYAPLAEFWASHGFAVIQPTHLSSKSLGIDRTPENYTDLFMASRAGDMTRILDSLDTVEAAIGPGVLQGRALDRDRIAVAGHSLGGWTASVLLGATNTDPREKPAARAQSFLDPRIKVGVIIGGTGAGGADLSDNGRQLLPFYQPDFSQMRTPTLIVWGEDDISPHLTLRGADWHADPFSLSPGPKDSFMVKGGKHGFGGISGWDAGETQDESPERLAAVQRLTWAYIQSQLYKGDLAWSQACESLKVVPELGKIESKIA